jgi:hypothetical protein
MKEALIASSKAWPGGKAAGSREGNGRGKKNTLLRFPTRNPHRCSLPHFIKLGDCNLLAAREFV